jgi:hypothetical protein
MQERTLAEYAEFYRQWLDGLMNVPGPSEDQTHSNNICAPRAGEQTHAELRNMILTLERRVKAVETLVKVVEAGLGRLAQEQQINHLQEDRHGTMELQNVLNPETPLKSTFDSQTVNKRV